MDNVIENMDKIIEIFINKNLLISCIILNFAAQ